MHLSAIAVGGKIIIKADDNRMVAEVGVREVGGGELQVDVGLGVSVSPGGVFAGRLPEEAARGALRGPKPRVPSPRPPPPNPSARVQRVEKPKKEES